MPKTIQKSALLFIAALFAVTSGITYAQCPKNEGKDKMPVHGEKTPGHMMIPDLTDSQKDKMETLRLDHMKTMQPMHNEIGEKEARLRTLQTADKVNMSEINALIEDIGRTRTEMMKLRAAHHQEVRSLLTDEQRVFFDARHPLHHGPREQHLPKHHDPR